MIEMVAEVMVSGVTGEQITGFMLNCEDKSYRDWWPGTHLAMHTIKRFAENRGNLVFFDEYVGNRRLRFNGIVVENIPGKKVVWQMVKWIKLPARVVLECTEQNNQLMISHTLRAGVSGIGRLLDPILRLYLNRNFEKDLGEHAHIEFTRLAHRLQSHL